MHFFVDTACFLTPRVDRPVGLQPLGLSRLGSGPQQASASLNGINV